VGIVYLISTAPRQEFAVSSVDPVSGDDAPVGTFTVNGVGVKASGAGGSDWLTRQTFSRDFAHMAVINNGGPGIEDGNGNVSNAGPAPSDGFGAQAPAAKTPLFRPGTDELWYADDNDSDNLYSIDTAKGGDPVAKHIKTFQGSFGFSPDGKMVVTGGGGRLLMAPDQRHGVGSELEAVSVANHLQATTPNNGIDLPNIPLNTKLGGCTPEAFVSSRALLCDLNLLTFSPSFASFHERPLLPPTSGNTASSSPVLSPDHEQVAFVSTNGNKDTAIWTVSVQGGTPKKVLDLPIDISTQKASLLEWT